MQAILHTLYDQIEMKKTETIRRVLSYSEADREVKPKPGEWSPAQVVDHLIFYENWMLAGSKQAIDAGETMKHGIRASVFTSILRFLIGRNRRVGTLKQFEPPEAIDLTAKLAEWGDIRSAMRTRLDDVTAERMKLAFTVHPFAGPMDAACSLELISLHLDYHLRYLPERTRTD